MTDKRPTLAIVGGTGALGSAMAGRLVRAGWAVRIGSRSSEKAVNVAKKLSSKAIGSTPQGFANADAVSGAEAVIVTVPFASQKDILEEIAPLAGDKIIIDTTVPLIPPKVARVQMPEEGCAALRAEAILGPSVRLVTGFHNVAAHKLAEEGDVDCDVLIFGDDPGDRDVAASIAEAMGLRPIHGGPLANSVAAEAFTSVLIGINKRYKADGAGVRITGLA